MRRVGRSAHAHRTRSHGALGGAAVASAICLTQLLACPRLRWLVSFAPPSPGGLRPSGDRIVPPQPSRPAFPDSAEVLTPPGPVSTPAPGYFPGRPELGPQDAEAVEEQWSFEQERAVVDEIMGVGTSADAAQALAEERRLLAEQMSVLAEEVGLLREAFRARLGGRRATSTSGGRAAPSAPPLVSNVASPPAATSPLPPVTPLPPPPPASAFSAQEQTQAASAFPSQGDISYRSVSDERRAGAGGLRSNAELDVLTRLSKRVHR